LHTVIYMKHKQKQTAKTQIHNQKLTGCNVFQLF